MTDPVDAGSVPPPLASPLRRLGGFGIDSILYAVLILGMLQAFGPPLDEVENGSEAVPGSVLFASLLVMGVYQVTLTAWRGQTIGKMAVRTKVVDADTEEIPGWKSSFIRWGAPAALTTVPILSYLAVLMFAWLLWDPRRQGLHDKAAGTVVISVTS